jgi:hypothetical protein
MSEDEYWVKEISDEDLNKQAAAGDKLLFNRELDMVFGFIYEMLGLEK